jgi:hypothetical protein
MHDLDSNIINKLLEENKQEYILITEVSLKRQRKLM